ncbi:hypothetical protein BU24DRAFT_420998 [Aaosphaeria arxii CBS 175.79]|uniref:DASH complex subunit ASK1 n=1 Tax=Aaosphaeria arxii CBS 175.79 TaxID=1450172 RepID=A0A6A5XYS3_9PLEO|nr:uncharacterized protein BU24DRAFT_420998 [Aaosphaeria arxii CBS 175.79]KAF2017967.1 hypothetical protein BU24DRAFT_420998 [Aaosphaeria arxii CBS 175.79]
MSRMSMAPQRGLSLTEELEKLEQSITLTLQEIDHNFSRAHRIVTTNILPIVEQYGKHSEAVWEGSKFWKQFFEASANVSLSGYEAPEEEGDMTAQESTQQSELYDETQDTVTGTTATPPRASSSQADALEDTSTLDSPSLELAHSTPRAPPSQYEGGEPSFAQYPSPYEELKKSMGRSRSPSRDPKTPGKTHTLPNMGADSSPFVAPSTSRRYDADAWKQDPIMHQMLDKTYRVMATPHSTYTKRTGMETATPGTTRGATSRTLAAFEDSSPPSSPAPQLRADIFSSPLKAPRTPGISVQTPGKGKQAEPFSVTRTKGIIFDSDSEDEDDNMGFSPPKTMHFHIPQSRLLQTPAREASKRIVDDLLMTAGGDITDSTGGLEEDSPSVVRRQVDLDDSF